MSDTEQVEVTDRHGRRRFFSIGEVRCDAQQAILQGCDQKRSVMMPADPTIRIVSEETGKPEALARLLNELQADPAVGSILVLAGEANDYTPETVDGILRGATKPLFGGIFPGIIFDGKQRARGTLAVGLPEPAAIAVLEEISLRPDMTESLAMALPPTGGEARTAFVFVDGLTSLICNLIDNLFNHFGLELNLLGGGCGSLSLRPSPCVITARGLLQDAAVVAVTGLPSGVGVAHGWVPVSEAYKVTEAKGNYVHTLDWCPAADVYRRAMEHHSGRQFDKQDFLAIAKSYPLGLARLGGEMVVRDPIAEEQGSIRCIGELRPGAFVRLLHGDTANLLSAATQASTLARDALGDHQENLAIFFDCISRALFLEDRFVAELDAARIPGVPMVGALTIGEIANNGQDYLEFYNKTAVMGVL